MVVSSQFLSSNFKEFTMPRPRSILDDLSIACSKVYTSGIPRVTFILATCSLESSWNFSNEKRGVFVGWIKRLEIYASFKNTRDRREFILCRILSRLAVLRRNKVRVPLCPLALRWKGNEFSGPLLTRASFFSILKIWFRVASSLIVSCTIFSAWKRTTDGKLFDGRNEEVILSGTVEIL